MRLFFVWSINSPKVKKANQAASGYVALPKEKMKKKKHETSGYLDWENRTNCV